MLYFSDQRLNMPKKAFFIFLILVWFAYNCDFFDLVKKSQMTILPQPYSGWAILLRYRLGAQKAPLFFSFICCPITAKLGVMVLWDKISQNIKDFADFSSAVSMTSLSSFWYRSRSEFEIPYLLSNLAEI